MRSPIVGGFDFADILIFISFSFCATWLLGRIDVILGWFSSPKYCKTLSVFSVWPYTSLKIISLKVAGFIQIKMTASYVRVSYFKSALALMIPRGILRNFDTFLKGNSTVLKASSPFMFLKSWLKKTTSPKMCGVGWKGSD